MIFFYSRTDTKRFENVIYIVNDTFENTEDPTAESTAALDTAGDNTGSNNYK